MTKSSVMTVWLHLGPVRIFLEVPSDWRDVSDRRFLEGGGLFSIERPGGRRVNLVVFTGNAPGMTPDRLRSELEKVVRADQMQVKSSRVREDLSLCGSTNNVLLECAQGRQVMRKLTCQLGSIFFSFTFSDHAEALEAVRHVLVSCRLVAGADSIHDAAGLQPIASSASPARTGESAGGRPIAGLLVLLIAGLLIAWLVLRIFW